MFRTDLPSIIRSLNTVYTATGICHDSYVDCLLQGQMEYPDLVSTVNITSMTNTCCCVYSVETPDDGR